ncbi:hypothetical protein Dimus_009170 [Dionaea muscipula]
MAELDGMRYGSERLKISKTPTSATSEQLLHENADTSSSWSPTFAKNHDLEEFHHHQKKSSVLTKVKEKAKKWRQLLIRKKHGDHTPSWGVALEEDEVDEDPEYLGAPMYESELAHDSCKEHARQHPRPDLVISKEHVLGMSVKSQADEENKITPPNPAEKTIAEHEDGPGPSMRAIVEDKKEETPYPPKETEIPPRPNDEKIVAEEEKKQKSLNPKNAMSDDRPGPSNETMAEGKKVHPGPNDERIIAQGEKQKPPSPKNPPMSDEGKGEVPGSEKTITESMSEKLGPAYITISGAAHAITSKIQGLSFSTTTEDSTSGNGGVGDRNWDKGVSVKEYIRNKFEPGEDEKALSQVISDAMSPKKNPGDKGVMEKVREAVTSLIQSSDEPPTNSLKTSNSSNHIPLSINAHEATEENQGRVLQAN